MALNPTLNQLSTLDFQDNLVLNFINSPDKAELVYDLSGGYNVLQMLMHVKGIKPRTTTGLNGIYQKPIMGVSRTVQQIASSSIVGTNLVVVFVDPTYSLFRKGFATMDSTVGNNVGRVIDNTVAGQVTLEPDAYITGLGGWASVSNPYPAGAYIQEMWNASGNRDSTGTESLYETPEYVSDYTAICRESSRLNNRDAFQTYAKYAGKYWYTAQDELALKRFARYKTWRSYFSKGGIKTGSGYQGDVNYTTGIRSAVQDPTRGGIYYPLTSPMAQGDLENFIMQISDRKTSSQNTLTLLMGRGALRQIQTFTTPFIQYGGNRNTFGGQTVEGLDVQMYSVAGVKCDFILDPVLNDTSGFGQQMSTIAGIQYGTRLQNTMIAIDLSDYEAIGGGGMLSSMEEIYFGNTAETLYGYVMGIVRDEMIDKSDLRTSGKLFANSRDGITFHAYEDSGLSLIANYCGWMELTN